MILNKNLISKVDNIETKEDLFKVMIELISNEKRTTNKEKLLEDILSRELEGSTAFEHGLMIPHSRSKFINEVTLAIVEFNDSDFDSLDAKKTNFAVGIFVPDSKADEHLNVLSKISTIFSSEDKLNNFKLASSEDKVKIINDSINAVFINESSDEDYDIVGITACAAGIAHTYMARDALYEAAHQMGYKIKIETRGAITENVLTEKEIQNAKCVVIAADLTISKTPFSGKKLYETGTRPAIKNAKQVIENAFAAEVDYGKGQKLGKLRIGNTDKSKGNILGKSVMSALSFMIPITIVGGILMAIPNAMAAGGNIEGGTWAFPNAFVEALWNFGHIGLIMMVPMLSMFLAFKLGGKPAMPAALIGGYFINDGALMSKFTLIDLPGELNGQVSAGFLGGLAVGIIVGYLVRGMRYIKWHPFIKPVSSLMVVPLVTSFLTFLIVVYVIGSPMTWIMAMLFMGLSKLDEFGGIWASLGVGMLFAALMAIDLGGPINKTTLTVATVIFTTTLANGDPNFVPQTAVQAAISVPPLGMWLSTMIFRKKFSQTEIAAGQAALPMGLVGVTEGALPFAFKTPLKAIAANMAGSVLAGALVSLFGISFYGGLGSPLGAYIGYMENSFFGLLWILSVASGAVLTAFVYGLLRNRVPEYEEAIKEAKAKKIAALEQQGIVGSKAIRSYKARQFRTNFKSRFVYMVNPKNWFEKPEDNGENEI
ncbi:fructose-specific PTS transporter subunit EIIC [Spiroplasma endosymbiont of Othius punctulatus]|uniref:PTS fructose transporter subunit IIABC n=1 Tax=Spiroplasma endosymbiont of Othius punctulatus TaxID=3066289 RepID=UPI0030CB76B4